MTVDEYISAAPVQRQAALRDLQTMVQSSFPDVEETMHYRMPTYVLQGKTFCAFASQKNYLALYIMPYDLLDAFQEELSDFDCGKSCIRFEELGKRELALFKRIIKHCGQHYSESKFFEK